MLNTLRNRLLASYFTIILVTLGFIGLTLLIFLRTRPLPTDEVVRELAANLIDVQVSQTLKISADLDTTTWQRTQDGEVIAIPLQPAVVSISAYLEDEAAARDLRTLIVSERGEVFFDSAGEYATRVTIPDFTRRPLAQQRSPGMVVNQVYQGQFKDPDGAEWIFVAQPLNPFLSFWQANLETLGEITGMRRRTGMDGDTAPGQIIQGQPGLAQANNLFVLVAQPPPHHSLREVFRLFGDTFFTPLLRAGILGLGVALLLAALIARSVARPLQHMSKAATQIARGDFDQRVPVNGPHEVRTLATTFNGMAQRVATTQQAQRDFLANVSHDLRTPLTSIQGFSQAIVDGVAADPQSAQHAAQIIHDEAARLHRMVEGLLDMARIEAGQFDMLRHAVRVDSVLQGVSDSLSFKAHEKELQLSCEIPAGLPRVAGDGDRLAQVFTNLIDNAIKHTPQGGQVSISARADTQHLVIQVADTGVGIPMDDLPRIFERFYQVDKSRQRRQRDGVGLGLAISQQIIEAHGGTLNVTSQVGAGTTFTILLPLPDPTMTTLVNIRQSS